MLTGGIGYSYSLTSTLPLTQTNLTKYPVTAPTATRWPAPRPPRTSCKVGGLIVIAPNVKKVATGYTGRRAIVEDARCNACHQELGTFTEDAFHAGQRNDGTTCSWCHTPNRASGGWSADSVYFVHAIHAGAKRSTKFTWDAATATSSFKDVAYPGVLNFCEGCHIPGGYVNFRTSPRTPPWRTGSTGRSPPAPSAATWAIRSPTTRGRDLHHSDPVVARRLPWACTRSLHTSRPPRIGTSDAQLRR